MRFVMPRRGRGAPGVTSRSAWRLGGASAWPLARRVLGAIRRHEVLGRAAGLSYYFLFALFPTLLFLTTLLGLLPVPDLMPRLIAYATRLLPGDAASLLEKTLAEIVRGANGGLLSIGAFAALWGASTGMVSIMAALNVAGQVVDRRPWWLRRLIALALTLAFALFTLTALLLLVFGQHIGEAVARWAGLGGVFTATWHLLRWPAVILFVLTGISLVYYLAPAGRRRWGWITPGSSFGVSGWLVVSLGLKLYVAYFRNYNATYGSIGGVILLMLWLYLTSIVLLTGAVIDAEIAGPTRSRAAVRPWRGRAVGSEPSRS